MYDLPDVSECLQQGVQHRIGTGETSKQTQEQGLLLWKQYAELNGINEAGNDGELEKEEEDEIFAEIEAEKVL